ncbi:hypothetical protein PR202_gn00063 [Eleusine coracana subsp. coracana]|uniref:Uncharacterized protein n=1 Tax=Eleusine coracana subsp. coracana TaxID=191504 RepID=A0AAV5G255_ELECO|nr:hypothetical protein PR202_gb20062 [Eleusine coracana subsp. coracana]GJN40765.1 hypothetical protein PR202_gn00063 [Eleusine coracana subsp. coracana]
MAAPPLPVSAFVTDLDGAIIIPEIDAAAVETTRRRDRAAKRACDWGPPLSEEGDACGWSSTILERGLALRRRRGPASSSRRGCGWIVDTAAATEVEHSCGDKETTTCVALAAKAVAQSEIDNSYLSCISINPIYY